ncbi:TonB-dependent receptor [Terrimonas sp. NA20]|uniref:TonB-dependent receptor n=1 Tax=Terrimonas ginsenosidimutans TaxID=2908004 RepID=A0ABS9KPZ6_9BACT|nr:TonB-dependent receptor [Terrimonas ginsenosidimutans]MCG2614394.1 TonB-dependent receptor [Terrimonas ginsenosidimutans]
MRQKRFPRVIAATIVLLLLSTTLFAQKRSVTGIISDQNNAPLSGATVTVKGEKEVTTTDANGAFRIAVSSDKAILVISYVGAKDIEIGTEGKTTVSGSVEITDTKLSEVVVIGYGSKKRADISSSISSVSSKDLKDLPVAGIDQALQGKVAGVTITNNSGQPGGGVSIKVRGVTTINSNDPLIVIDGVPFMSNTKSSTGYAGLGGSDGQTGNSVMATLNPGDIESVDILKDASAQAIYGSLAANGVVLITTKKGKTGEGKVNYDVYYGQQRVTRHLDLMNLREFAKYQNETAPLLGLTPSPEFADPSKLGEGTNWQDAMFRTGQVQNHQLSFSGGKDKTNYYLSVNYFNQEGILIGSDFKRYSTRFSLDHQLKSWLKVGVSANGSRSIQNVTLADAAEGTIWWGAVQSPLIPVKNLDGSWGGGQMIGGFQYSQDNPIARSYYRGNKSVSSQVFGNIYADVQFLKNFSLRNEISYSLGLNNNTAHQLAGNIGPTALRAQLFDGRGNSYYYAIRNYLNYNKYFGKHSISGTAGHEAQYSYFEQISGKKVDLQNNILDLNTGSSDRTTWELGGGKSHWAMESYFARGQYTYDNRYSLSLTIRADGSSNFGPNNKWGYFPAGSFAWTVSNEAFAQNWKSTVTNLKLRLGYGSVGNQNLPSGAQNPPYVSAIGFWTGPVGFGNSNYLNGITNPNLSWESVKTKNIGVDATLFNGFVDLSVDVYRKTTSDMLLFLTGPRLIGVGDSWDDLKAPIGNVGQMSNNGIDISINTNNIRSKDFTWKTNLIFSKFTNKLDKMANSTAGLTGRVYYDNYTITYTNPGYAVGSFFGLVTDGLFRNQSDLNGSLPQFGYAIRPEETWLGDIRFKDVSGADGKPDNVIDANDITFIGSPLPKFTYGITNTFSFKGFDASFFLQGSYGAKIFNFLRWQLEKMDNAFYNQMRSVQDRYTDANTGGSLPRFTNTNSNNVYMSDRYVESGSYMRIQNVTLGYRIPTRILNKAKITNVRLYMSIQNLHTFSDYSGYDPEVGAFNNNIRLMNVDMGHYPNPRSFTFGANIEL